MAGSKEIPSIELHRERRREVMRLISERRRERQIALIQEAIRRNSEPINTAESSFEPQTESVSFDRESYLFSLKEFDNFCQREDISSKKDRDRYARSFNEQIGGLLADDIPIYELRVPGDLGSRKMLSQGLKNNISRSINALALRNITTVGEMRALTLEDLDSMRRLGPGISYFIHEGFKKQLVDPAA